MRLLLLIASLCIAIGACDTTDGRFTEQRIFAMGTWVDAIFEARDEDAEIIALRDVENLLRSFERDYYAWSDGELSRVNSAIASSQALPISPEMAELLAYAQRISASSQGHFDPGVASLVELWGFHSGVETAAEPAPQLIRDWLADDVGIRNLSIRDRNVSADSSALQLDLGGIAKGAAVDRIIGLLIRHGVENALVNAGGDLRAIGTRPNRRWRVGIKAPRSSGLLGYVELADGEAAFTSGDYERYFDVDGQRMHHILDPLTGYPATHTQAITVIANDGTTADAAATALFVAGPEKWRDIAAALSVDTVLRVDISGAIEMTEPMRARLRAADADESADGTPTS